MLSFTLRLMPRPAAGLAALALMAASPAVSTAALAAQVGNSGFGTATTDTNFGPDTGTSDASPKRHEKMTVHGHRSLPPGYQEAPSVDINHGPDPDHDIASHRDAVTGTDLSKFGSAYQESGPMQGKLGDSTGNGWVTPR
ncbi:hypothetical protein LOC54_04430 [Acetobacter sp. AN02]|uniref:hypothetical protein n=1 Tax=Acetobacter sp. AN02 TaxID=2894186 RepID=UPI0024343AE2|nr:hypothetical protein [Acetobacter sp. AN02]MDG6094364.1 hypothetical protein [Acetobacter sp. AN02]